jgi:transposase
VRVSKLVRLTQAVEHTVVETVGLVWGEDGEWVLTARVRPDRRRASRCSRCGRRCPGWDQGSGERRWRGLDFGTVRVFLVGAAPRVRCREHGVVVAATPWARPGSRFTHAFEDTVAWLTAHTAQSVVARLMRVTWRTVVGIVSRVTAELAGKTDRLGGLVRVGIDEVSYRKVI